MGSSVDLEKIPYCPSEKKDYVLVQAKDVPWSKDLRKLTEAYPGVNIFRLSRELTKEEQEYFESILAPLVIPFEGVSEKGGTFETQLGSASILDVCCGSRMFWFDPKDERVIFLDKRRETHLLPDKSSAGGSRKLVIDPDIQANFTALPFEDDMFSLVVFDPPHLIRAGKKGWLAKKYGKLEGDWQEELRKGFMECFRVLHPAGTLIFKWNEYDIPVSQVLALTPERPLFGNRCGKKSKSHWIVFIKTIKETSKNKQ